MVIEIRKLSKEELEKMGIFKWPIWEKEVSEFNWYYSEEESCYILDGEVDVKTSEGVVHFGKGDFVVFPKGLSCVWKIKRAVRKHYKFG